eukprot:12062-Heterococcus_DN1.PRE.2
MNDASFPAIERVLSRRRQDRQQHRANSESTCTSHDQPERRSMLPVQAGTSVKLTLPAPCVQVDSLRAALNELDSFINATAPAADQ